MIERYWFNKLSRSKSITIPILGTTIIAKYNAAMFTFISAYWTRLNRYDRNERVKIFTAKPLDVSGFKLFACWQIIVATDFWVINDIIFTKVVNNMWAIIWYWSVQFRCYCCCHRYWTRPKIFFRYDQLKRSLRFWVGQRSRQKKRTFCIVIHTSIANGVEFISLPQTLHHWLASGAKWEFHMNFGFHFHFEDNVCFTNKELLSERYRSFPKKQQTTKKMFCQWKTEIFWSVRPKNEFCIESKNHIVEKLHDMYRSFVAAAKQKRRLENLVKRSRSFPFSQTNKRLNLFTLKLDCNRWLWWCVYLYALWFANWTEQKGKKYNSAQSKRRQRIVGTERKTVGLRWGQFWSGSFCLYKKNFFGQIIIGLEIFWKFIIIIRLLFSFQLEFKFWRFSKQILRSFIFGWATMSLKKKK